MPFANISDDADQEYFADGISEDLITGLSRIRRLLVIARNSAFVYKGRTVDVKQVWRELGVRYVLEGSVRRAGKRLRVSAQLVDALSSSSSASAWATGSMRSARGRRPARSLPIILPPSAGTLRIERAAVRRAAWRRDLDVLFGNKFVKMNGSIAVWRLAPAALQISTSTQGASVTNCSVRTRAPWSRALLG